MARRSDTARAETAAREEGRADVTATQTGSGGDVEDAALHALAAAAGVQATYRDGTDKWRTAPEPALRRILRALGLPADDAVTARRSLAGLRRARVQPGLSDVVVAWDGGRTPVRVRVLPEEADTVLGLRILFEDGGERDWEHAPDASRSASLHAEGTWSVAHDILLPGGLPFGYHTLEVRVGENVHRAHLVSAPRSAPQVERPEWGVFVPTYSLMREDGDGFGVGDLTDLRRLAGWVAECGGSIVATLPLLDMFLSGPVYDPSPYAPVSRRFWNGLLVDPTAEPEYTHPSVQGLVKSEPFQRGLQAVRRADSVDHARVWELKARVFTQMAKVLHDTTGPRRRAFTAFLRRHPDVERYARFRAATEEHGTWHGWPEAAQGGDLSEMRLDADLVRMHAYLQWIADGQVARISEPSGDVASGTPEIRLHLDLPLGAHPAGYDSWNDRLAYAEGIETGAPPDGFFEKGQKWGFRPLNPRRLRQSGYRHFAACLRNHLRHATLLRIDHVMGLHRTFWVPNDRAATDGAYVHYPHEELYAVVLLEAHRAGAVVVGEDLGTVPPAVHEAMDRHHVHRTFVLQLQARAGNGSPPMPPPNSLATINTHDMVPFAAWWRGDDITQRVSRGFLDESGAAAARARREQTKARLLARLQEYGDGPPPPGPPAASDGLPADAAEARDESLRFLFHGRAPLVVINLEDLWLETRPQNQPGYGPDTAIGKTNWGRRTAWSLERITSDPRLARLLEDLSRLRPTETQGDRP